MFHHPVSHNEAGLELDLRVVHCATMSCDQCLVSGWFYPGSAWSAQVTTGQSEASMGSWWPIRVPGYTRSDPGLTFGHQPTWSACSLLSQFNNQIYLHLKACFSSQQSPGFKNLDYLFLHFDKNMANYDKWKPVSWARSSRWSDCQECPGHRGYWTRFFSRHLTCVEIAGNNVGIVGPL